MAHSSGPIGSSPSPISGSPEGPPILQHGKHATQVPTPRETLFSTYYAKHAVMRFLSSVPLIGNLVVRHVENSIKAGLIREIKKLPETIIEHINIELSPKTSLDALIEAKQTASKWKDHLDMRLNQFQPMLKTYLQGTEKEYKASCAVFKALCADEFLVPNNQTTTNIINYIHRHQDLTTKDFKEENVQAELTQLKATIVLSVSLKIVNEDSGPLETFMNALDHIAQVYQPTILCGDIMRACRGNESTTKLPGLKVDVQRGGEGIPTAITLTRKTANTTGSSITIPVETPFTPELDQLIEASCLEDLIMDSPPPKETLESGESESDQAYESRIKPWKTQHDQNVSLLERHENMSTRLFQLKAMAQTQGKFPSDLGRALTERRQSLLEGVFSGGNINIGAIAITPLSGETEESRKATNEAFREDLKTWKKDLEDRIDQELTTIADLDRPTTTPMGGNRDAKRRAQYQKLESPSPNASSPPSSRTYQDKRLPPLQPPNE